MTVQPINVSIAMATYNGERFLREQLHSLAWQTHLPCELVVGDDGSTDGTLDILKDFAKTAPFPVHITPNPVNLGYGENFLQTASRCRGEWIAFCDQDDVWLSFKLSRFCLAAAARPDADWIISKNIRMNSSLDRRLNSGFSLSGESWMPLSSPVRFHDGHRMVFKKYYVDLPWKARPLSTDGCQISHDRWLSALSWLIGERLYLQQALTVYRRHASAIWSKDEEPSLGENKREDVPTWIDNSFYEERAHFWREMADWCRRTSGHTEAALAQRLLGAVSKSEGIAEWYSLRATAHSNGRQLTERLSALIRLLTDGAYTSCFGVTPFAKDLTKVILRLPSK